VSQHFQVTVVVSRPEGHALMMFGVSARDDTDATVQAGHVIRRLRHRGPHAMVRLTSPRKRRRETTARRTADGEGGET
jgi:hypothetical protein